MARKLHHPVKTTNVKSRVHTVREKLSKIAPEI